MSYLRMPLLWAILQGLKPSGLESSKVMKVDYRNRSWLPLMVLIIAAMFACVTGYILMFAFNPLPLVFFGGILLGLVPTIGVGMAIGGMQLRGHYDLISLLPGGRISVDLRLASHFFRNNIFFNVLRRLHLAVQVFFFIYSSVMGITALLSIIAGKGQFFDYTNIANFLMLGIIVRADYMYSSVIGTLTGMFSASVGSRRIDSALIAAAAFISIQLTTYFLFGFLTTLVSSLGGLVAIVATVLIFLAIREAAVYILWEIIAQRVNTDLDELLYFDKNEVYHAMWGLE